MSETSLPDADVQDAADVPDAADADVTDAAADAASLTTAPVEADAKTVTLPHLGTLGMLRWAWRQLTSMRIALILLFLLSLAAIPGSLIPQRNVATDPARVQDYLTRHKLIGPILDKLQFFEVYKSAWFSAIYLLLFISLIGCILPRTWAHAKVLRKPPPPAPRNLGRMPTHLAWRDETANPDAVKARLDAAEKALKAKHFRVIRGEDANGGWVSAEKGYLREVGNLLFHIALVGILAGFAIKGHYGYTGKVRVTEGKTFTNISNYYDDKDFGGGVDVAKLPTFKVTLDSFAAQYNSDKSSPTFGEPRGFQAYVDYLPAGATVSQKKTITENHPLTVDGTNIYLTSHGYAPVITVKDQHGTVVFHDAVMFNELDSMFKSAGTVKILDGLTDPGDKIAGQDMPIQVGLSALFLPTFDVTMANGPQSLYPAATVPELIINAYSGELGNTASIYTMDVSKAKQLALDPANKRTAVALAPGDSVNLPGGLGSVTFDGVKQYVQFDITHDPSKQLVLPSAVAIVLGLVLSLGIRRRRVFVRVRPVGGGADGEGSGEAGGAGTRTVSVEVAGLARAEDARLADEVRGVAAGLRPKKKPTAQAPQAPTKKTDTSASTSGAGQ